MVGDQIAAARGTAGLTVEDLARRTRIPAARLKALEADAYELLPPPIYSRGYVRACAIELGLDPDALVRQFEAERPVPASSPPPSPPIVELGEISDSQRMRGFALIALGIGAVAFLLWTGGQEADPVAGLPVAAAGEDTTAGAPTPVATIGDGGSDSVRGVSLDLAAARECWVTVTADDRRVMYRLMQPGETARIDAAQEIVLRAGDAGALTVAVNGGPAQALGGDGQVRTVTFATPGARM